MRNFLFDLRLVCRQLGKSPGFAAAILMLALGIGATTAIFSVIDGVLLRPLPFPDPSRLVTLGDQLGGTNWGQQDAGPVTGPEVLTYPRDTRSFASLGGYQGGTYELGRCPSWQYTRCGQRPPLPWLKHVRSRGSPCARLSQKVRNLRGGSWTQYRQVGKPVSWLQRSGQA